MSLLERIRKAESGTTEPERLDLDQVRARLDVAPAADARPLWIRELERKRAAAGGRLVATKEL